MRTADLAALIPAEYRREILELNMIDSAVAAVGDTTMHYLTIVWTDYIEPGFTGDCPLCLGTCLNGFKALKKDLIELEKNSKLLDQV